MSEPNIQPLPNLTTFLQRGDPPRVLMQTELLPGNVFRIYLREIGEVGDAPNDSEMVHIPIENEITFDLTLDQLNSLVQDIDNKLNTSTTTEP